MTQNNIPKAPRWLALIRKSQRELARPPQTEPQKDEVWISKSGFYSPRDCRQTILEVTPNWIKTTSGTRSRTGFLKTMTKISPD